ncbi:MAG: dynamin family protein [Planctomycetota bacterium]|nr:dynamin family protein [Planctomycetota bacterium]
MLRQILPEEAVEAVERERVLLERVRALAETFEPDGQHAIRIGELLTHLDDMFLLVVVGEVKSGKSAFINALLDADICPEGPTPLTDRVHVLAYGEEESETALDAHIIRRTFPVDSLEHMNVVDTPGTNAPLMRHQEITENFLPRADIVFFVTSIDCPLTHTEIELLKEIRQRWRKEVACVLAKIDMHPVEDRQVVLEYLQSSFREHLGFNPPVFPVSAHQAREARAAGDEILLAKSGFPEVEKYIVENLSDSRRVLLKLKSPLGPSLDVLDHIDSASAGRLAVLERDFAGWKALQEQINFASTSLVERAERHFTPIAVAFENLEARGRHYLRDMFRLSNLRLLGDSKRFAEEFMAEVVRDAAQEIETKVQAAVAWLGTETGALWERSVAFFKENVAAEKYEGEIVKGDSLEFDRTRRELLDGIVESTRRQWEGWNAEAESKRIHSLASRSLARLLKTEAVAAGLGATVAATLGATVLGIVGLALAACVALGGFFILPARRLKAVESFEDGLRKTRHATLAALREAVSAEAERSTGAILDAFAPFGDFYENRLDSLQSVRGEAGELKSELRRFQASFE